MSSHSDAGALRREQVSGERWRVVGKHAQLQTSLSNSCKTRSAQAVAYVCSGIVEVWNVVTGACERTLEGHGDKVTALAKCNEGGWLAVGSDRQVKLWSTTTWTCEHALATLGDVTALAAAAPRMLCAGSASLRAVNTWRFLANAEESERGGAARLDCSPVPPSAGIFIERASCLPLGSAVHSLVMCGSILIAGLGNGSIAMVRTNFEMVWERLRTLEHGHTSAVTSLVLCGGTGLASGSQGELRLWS